MRGSCDCAEAPSYSGFQIGVRQSFNRNRSPWLAETNDLLRHADADLEHAWTIYATRGRAPSQLVTCTTPDGELWELKAVAPSMGLDLSHLLRQVWHAFRVIPGPAGVASGAWDQGTPDRRRGGRRP